MEGVFRRSLFFLSLTQKEHVMLKHKKETVIAASFFAIALVAVVIKNNTLEPELVSEETAVAPAFQWEEPFYGPEDTSPPVEEEAAPTHASANPSTPLMPGRMSFGQAFSQARLECGPGALFTWNDKTYTTSYAEELVAEKEKSALVNIVANAITVEKKVEE